ncbi:NCS1 family nucleobase:cation symporter-1 [Gordonia insulae]|uniref:Putative allantoin permease n=1 Tax=Gordonia insulae TaxID=2420509 RepID=A0A3G8JST7_9ACTN|nr:NCS1 family nucleobase:cation symporter-1 [Gordonia insulae]AZG47998.1 putative allantoin permease [Gordonia insulae]
MSTSLRPELATADLPVPPDPRLTNADLLPTKERRWGVYSIFALWMADTHAISNYTFAAGLFVLGLTPWQVFASLLIGISVVCWFMNRMGLAGHTTGVPFPVLARASFGVFGANLPALVRAVMAIFWYGIQTWLASVALVVLTVQLAPSLDTYTQNSFLGLSTLGWAAFMFMWLLQLLLLTRGMEFIRRTQDWLTGPLVWIVMICLAGYLLVKSDWSISLTDSLKPMSGPDQAHQMLVAISLTVATFLTLVLNYADFSRFTKTKRSYLLGNILGLPINFTLFAVASVLTTAGSVVVFGELLTEPVEIVAAIDNPAVTIIGAATFVIATIGINVVANFVSPAYDLANLWPSRINFTRGGLIAAVLAVLVTPWNLYSNPVVVNYFLGALAAFLGPLVAILLVDFYLIRRRSIDVDALFDAREGAPYVYRRGWNPRALIAFVPSAAACAVLALVPAFATVAPFAWILGMVVAGAIYLTLNRSRPSSDPSVDLTESVTAR